MTHAPRPDRGAPAPLPLPVSKLILFDLDGVLVDTLPVMRSAWQAVCAQHGIDIPFRSYAKHLGRPFSDIMATLGVRQIEEVASTYDAVSTRDAHLARPFPGIEAALHTITAGGQRIGVVTSKPLARAVPLLERLRCPFSVVRAPGRERGKPAPDTLLAALVETGTDPADATYVGDMAVDQEAARRGGLRYVHAGWGYGEPTAPEPLTAHEPAQLFGLLRDSLAPEEAA
ncbi:HAD family hydrolase [Streptomyces sp. NPDC088197]|uniref:HAD family hydrolase n=1 Tax=Streptomyces sp. NPDC088197 TaxID=3365840 RepID=UPI00380FE65A